MKEEKKYQPIKRIFNSNTMTWQYSDGSGNETFEWRLRKELLVDKAKMLGVEGKRNWISEFAEVNKLLEDREKLQSKPLL